MNEDNYLFDLLKNYSYQTRRMDSSLTTQQIYERLWDLELHSRKDTDMSWNYSYDRHYRDTRGDEVATAVLEAYSKGVSFDTLLKKNTAVRQYWAQVQHDMLAKEKAREREAERQRKLAEKRAIEQAKREEVMTKLTPEELAAFGLVKKTRKGTKR